MVQGKIIKRLLGQPTTDHNGPEHVAAFEASRVDSSSLRPASSQYARLLLNSPITCLDQSSDGGHAVLAGDAVFKTIKVEGATVTEEFDVRAAIAAQLSSHDNSLGFNDPLNIKAVKWSHSELNHIILTASAHGRMTAYDLNQIGTGVEVGRMRAHERQVNKMAISPFRPNWLLSASHDATVRLFDIKNSVGGGPSFRSWNIFHNNSDAVRDVKWNPLDGFKFACSTASGAILCWDTRKHVVPIMKIQKAHDDACMSISWHPDGKHLISGGLDQQCSVWNLSETGDRKQKPKYTLSTPAPVSIVDWRPPCWSSTAGAKRAAQVVVAYDDTNPMKFQNSTVHIWDIARPHLPFKEIAEFEASPRGLLWHERDLLWTVERDGSFRQIDVAFAPKVIDRRSLSTFDLSPSGEVLMLLEERRGAPRPRAPMSGGLPTDAPHVASLENQCLMVGQLGISQSDSEEDVSGSFLGPRIRDRKQGPNHASRPGTSLSSTPPSLLAVDGTMMTLEDAVTSSGPYRPQQIMATGNAPSTINRDVYQYLSSRYLQRLGKDFGDTDRTAPSSPSIPVRLSGHLEYFAQSAERVGQFRMAQTWRIFAYTFDILLTRRSHHHRRLRLMQLDERKAEQEKLERKALKENQWQTDQQVQNELTPRKAERIIPNPLRRSMLTEEMESTSNMTTPLARPVRDSMIYDSVASAPPLAVENDRLELPPVARAGNARAYETPDSTQKYTGSSSSLEGYDFYDLEHLATPAININAPLRKAPLRLDGYRNQADDPKLGALARHDSNESFQMFSSSGDSQSRKFPSPSESGGLASLPAVSQRSVPDGESNWTSSAASSDLRSDPRTQPDEGLEGDDDYEPNSPEISTLPPTMRIRRPSADDTNREGKIGLEAGRMPRGKTNGDEQENSSEVLESDYLPHPSDPLFLPKPIDPHVLVQKSINFETQTGCLNAAIMVLLLKPLLSSGTIDDHQSAAILQQFHRRLDSMMLFTETTLLRKLCYPVYPSVYSQGQPRNIGSMGYYCTTCQKPVQEGDLALGERMQQCYRCKTSFGPCGVCKLHEEPPPLLDEDLERDSRPVGTRDGKPSRAFIDLSSSAARLWWWCQGCGHGGHTACMRTWHSADGAEFSEGCCPLDGCLHPCLPGKWRSEFFANQKVASSEELSKLVKESTRGGPKGLRVGNVKRDKSEVGESKAVESVRATLSGGSFSTQQTGERERKKGVKVVAPGDK